MTYEIEDIEFTVTKVPVDFDIGKNVTGIYQIVNASNGHSYIGSAVNIKKRWNLHRLDCEKQKHHSCLFQSAYNVYGLDGFEFKILEICDREVLLEREQHYIDNLKPIYNVLPKAGSSLGVKATPERCAKISAALKGRKFSDETRAKISAAQRGKVLSDEHRVKLSASGKGKHSGPKSEAHRLKIAENNRKRAGIPLSEETKTKISETLKGNQNAKGNKAFTGYTHSEETRLKMSIARKKRVTTAETRAKMSAARLGKKHSIETRAKMSNTAKANKQERNFG